MIKSQRFAFRRRCLANTRDVNVLKRASRFCPGKGFQTEAALAEDTVDGSPGPMVRPRMMSDGRLQRSLLTALEERQFELNYQPVVDLATGRVLGGEALVRWRHPERGLQGPDHFIPHAERSGLIVPLGTWVLDDAIRTLHAWRRAGIMQPRIAINVAAAQLRHPTALRDMRARIVASGLDPRKFGIELTESAFIDPTADTLTRLNALRDIGVTIAVDDFGTGYSSLHYLRALPVDTLKIDKSFVRHLSEGSSDMAIVRGIIAIARDLGLNAVVEGIETAEQRDILLAAGCRIGQGYFYSRPLTSRGFAALLRRQP